MSNKLTVTGCQGEDVIAFSSNMYRVDRIISAFEKQLQGIATLIRDTFIRSEKIDAPVEIYLDGANCEVLGAYSKGWKKGKVRIKFELEFIPDEIESSSSEASSLDSLRAVTDEN